MRDYRARVPRDNHAHHEKHRVHILEYHRRYYAQNAEMLRRKQREYAAANPEKVAERKRLAHIAKRESDNARVREWCAANPERVRACVARYKARRRGAAGTITGKDIAAQYEQQRGTCFYCARSLAHCSYHVDHYVPLSRGGTNEPSNIRLACPGCNWAKRNKMPADFKAAKE